MTDNKLTALLYSWGGFGVTKWLAAIGIHSWSDFAGMTAGTLSTLMILEWLWKRWRGRARRRRE